jgi:hypothetical protein
MTETNHATTTIATFFNSDMKEITPFSTRGVSCSQSVICSSYGVIALDARRDHTIQEFGAVKAAYYSPLEARFVSLFIGCAAGLNIT